MSRLGGRSSIQGIIDQLTAQRAKDLSRIEGLFDQFGVTARQDLEQTLVKQKAQRQQDLISRGLSQTTKRATSMSDLAAQGARGRAAIGEQVAQQKAGFLERQLVDPSLITNLITQAAATNTQPVSAALPASPGQAAINAGQSGMIRANRGGGGGGGGAGGGGGFSGFGVRGGSGGSGGGAFVIGARGTQAAGTPSTSGVTQGARTIQSPTAGTAAVSGTTGQASLRSGQASGTGSIRSTETGKGFETQTGQDRPTAIGAAPTEISPGAGGEAPTGRATGGGGGRTITIQAGINARAPGGIGSTRTVTVPPGLTNVQAVQQGIVPWGWRIISG